MIDPLAHPGAALELLDGAIQELRDSI